MSRNELLRGRSGSATSTKAISSALLFLSRPEARCTADPLTVWGQLRVQPADSLTAQLASPQYSTTGSPSIWTGSLTLDGRVASLLPVCVGLIRGQTPDGKQLSRLIDSSACFNNRHARFSQFVESTESIRFDFYSRRFSSNDTPTVSQSLWTAFWIFKFNFNLPFCNVCCKVVIISLQYPISYML